MIDREHDKPVYNAMREYDRQMEEIRRQTTKLQVLHTLVVVVTVAAAAVVIGGCL